MSILIRGMEMPKSCWRCSLSQLYEKPREMLVCKITHDEVLRHKIDGNCPLIEVPTPHGRLIDADALEVRKHEKEAYDTVVALYKQKKFNANYEYYRGYSDGLVTASGLVRFAPTIIESEGKNVSN